MSGIPIGWTVARVGDLVTLGPKNDLDDDLQVGFVPLQRLGTTYRSRHSHEAKRWAAVKKGYTHFANGDVLLARITPSFENGKAGIVRGLPNGKGAGSTEYFVCRPQEEALIPQYLLAYFKTTSFLRAGKQVMTGAVGQQRVPKQYVLNSEIPLPPLQEQKRIADKLDELLVAVDACKARLDGIRAIIKRFRQSVLTAAISGELTDDWRKEKKRRQDWAIKVVGDLAEVATGKTPLKSNSAYYKDGDVPWLTSAVTGKKMVTATETYVTSLAVRECGLKMFQPGTLLVAMYGEGKTRGQVSELTFPATINQACAAIIADSKNIQNRYLKIRLEQNYEKIRELASGGNQPNLNLSKVRGITIPVPPLDEQEQIVICVDALFEMIELLELRVKNARARVDHMTQSILAKVFRGELIPQDPNDEPAEQLLSRIKSQRAASPTAKPKRGRKKKASAE